MSGSLRNLFTRREKVLGVARGRRRYDLPLAKSSSNGFLRILIGLMCVLGILALAASFALSAMTARWTDGLAGRISVEIPATDSGGEVIAPGIVRSMTAAAHDMLSGHPDVAEAKIAGDEEVKQLLAPWLGEDMAMDSIPVPGLISVTFRPDTAPDMDALAARLKEAAPRARIDTHESWLSDVLKFTGALQFAAALLTAIIAATTLIAVAGGVRSKLNENREELELLHLMGATDSYIAAQIQRHTLILSLQGGALGVVLGALALLAITLAARGAGVSLIPDFSLSPMQVAMLALIPLPIGFLAMATSRVTVLRALGRMP